MPTEWLWLSNGAATMTKTYCHTVVQVCKPPFLITVNFFALLFYNNCFQRKVEIVKEEILSPLKICSDQVTDMTVKIQLLV